MLHHPHHLLSSAAPLLGVSACLERETKTKQQNTQTPTKQLGVGQSHRTLRSCRRVGGPCSHAWPVPVPCVGQLPRPRCVNLNFRVNLNLCISCLCVVLFCSIVGLPGLPPRVASGCAWIQRLPILRIPPLFSLLRLRTNFRAFSMFCLIFPAAESASTFLLETAAL